MPRPDAHAGNYDTLVTIQQRGEGTTNGMNEFVPAWTTFTTAWVKIRDDATGQEVTEGNQQQARVTSKLYLRSNPTTRQITPKMRVTFGGRVLEIVSAVDLGNRKIEIELTCRETVG